MSDRRPNKHGEQSSMSWPTAWTLRPDDLGVHAPIAPRLKRQPDLVVVTNMISHGVDVTELGLLRLASVELQGLGVSWLVEAKDTPRSTSLRGEELTRSLLRTAEETIGFPCVASGLLHGLEPTPVALTGDTKIATVRRVLDYLGRGESWAAFPAAEMMRRLHQDLHMVQLDERPQTKDDSKSLADVAVALSTLLLDMVQRRLNGAVRQFVHLAAVPLTESSPCGVLRLAARRVPRAPGADLIPGPSTFALAA